MVNEIKPSLETNIIFTTMNVVSLHIIKYQFLQLRLWHFISATKIRLLRISICHKAPFIIAQYSISAQVVSKSSG